MNLNFTLKFLFKESLVNIADYAKLLIFYGNFFLIFQLSAIIFSGFQKTSNLALKLKLSITILISNIIS